MNETSLKILRNLLAGVGLSKDRVLRDRASAVYSAIVDKARDPVFFTDLAAPDTPEGRFEILTIHVWLVLRKLQAEGSACSQEAQAILDIFFQNMDDALREMGVGDLSVGKKIRRMAEAFYGRVSAYGAAVDAGAADDLADALGRNVYGQSEPDAPARALSGYILEAAKTLDAASVADILDGRMTFPPLTASAAA